MQEAVNRFQQNLFTTFLYISAFYGVILDLLNSESRPFFNAVFDGMIFLLGFLSFSRINKPLLAIVFFFIACVILNFSYAEVSLLAGLNGTREILTIVFIAVFFHKYFNSLPDDEVEQRLTGMRQFAYAFLFCQIPITIYQFIENGGPGDAVGGSYGAYGSGVLTMTVICLVYFLHLSADRPWKIVFLYLSLIPLFLNETKVSFILIPLMLFFVGFQLRLKKVVLAAAVALGFFLLFSMYYRDQSVENSLTFSEIFSEDFLDYYLVGDIYTYYDIPRFTKILLGWQLISEHATTFLFGIEYGLFKGGDTLRDSDFSRSYYWLLTGTRPYLFFLLLQGGVMLLTAVLVLIGYINNFFQAINKFQIFLFIIFFIILFYNDIFRNQTFLALYFFLVYFANSRFYLITQNRLTYGNNNSQTRFVRRA